MGLAVGAKLVAGTYAVGLVAACVVVRGPLRERVIRTANFGLFAAAGALITGGYWAWLMFRHYGNPLFPFFNAIFKSPLGPAGNLFDGRFFPRGLVQTLFYPFFFSVEQNLASELSFADARLAAGYVSIAIIGVVALFRRRNSGASATTPPQSRLLVVAVFATASYVAWLKMFSIYRYVVPLELLGPVLVIGCAAYVMHDFRKSTAIAAAVCLLLIATTRAPDWGRVAWSESYFGVDDAALSKYENATVLLWDAPDAYLVPFFPESTTFLRISNEGTITENRFVQQKLHGRIRSAAPEALFLIEVSGGSDSADKQQVLTDLNLAVDSTRCQDLLAVPEASRICALRPIADKTARLD
jgi:hypothetical protein